MYTPFAILKPVRNLTRNNELSCNEISLMLWQLATSQVLTDQTGLNRGPRSAYGPKPIHRSLTLISTIPGQTQSRYISTGIDMILAEFFCPVLCRCGLINIQGPNSIRQFILLAFAESVRTLWTNKRNPYCLLNLHCLRQRLTNIATFVRR